MTPGQASAAGAILLIDHPIGGRRYMMHTFDLASGGVAWVDSGWTDPLASSHMCHYLEGAVNASSRGWLVYTSTEETAPIEVSPRAIPHEGEREVARHGIQEEFYGLVLCTT